MCCSSIMLFSSLTWGWGSKKFAISCGYQNVLHKTKSQECTTVLFSYSSCTLWYEDSLWNLGNTWINIRFDRALYIYISFQFIVEFSCKHILYCKSWNKAFLCDYFIHMYPRFVRWGKNECWTLLNLFVIICFWDYAYYLLCVRSSSSGMNKTAHIQLTPVEVNVHADFHKITIS